KDHRETAGRRTAAGSAVRDRRGDAEPRLRSGGAASVAGACDGGFARPEHTLLSGKPTSASRVVLTRGMRWAVLGPVGDWPYSPSKAASCRRTPDTPPVV